VIDVALLGIIRRWHLRDQVSLREISRRLGISRNTVRRYLRSEAVEPVYAERNTPSALDRYALKLSAWLKTESSKSRKQRRSLRQLHADLCVLGFEGSYDRVAAFARQWKVDQLGRVNSASKGTPSLKIKFKFTFPLYLKGFPAVLRAKKNHLQWVILLIINYN
jgi:transcriptional regulator with XRE-family HTH domain